MEKDGTATRVKGGKPGIPDTWTLAGPPAGRRRAGQTGSPGTGQPGDGPAAQPDGPRRGRGSERRQPGRGCRRPPAPDSDQPRTPDAETTAEPGDDAPAEDDPDARPSRTTRPRRTAATAPRIEARATTPAEAPTAPGDAPDPALVTEITERTGQIKAAADAAEQVLTASGDLKTALAGMDEIYEQAAQARRSLKAAIGGRKAPAARPGGLRDKVLAHLDAHPGREFTPHEIHKVLSHSSGAIANALDTLVKHGDAEVATEKPRRFRRRRPPAGRRPRGGDSAEQDGTDLAGAA